jgi:hypothetical protein
MDDWIMATRASEKEEVMKRGRIESILRQYSRKALDFHRPWTATTSGGTPLSKSSVAPPILKQWPVSSINPASFQTWLQRKRNHVWVIGDQFPDAVSKANKGACGGTIALAERWWLNAETGLVKSSTRDKIIFVPAPSEVFDHGITNDDQETPFGGDLRVILVERATWREGSKELTESMISSPSLY